MVILWPIEECVEKLLKANTYAAVLLMVNGNGRGLIICESDLGLTLLFMMKSSPNIIKLHANLQICLIANNPFFPSYDFIAL